MQKATGVVAVFDILGYKAFLANSRSDEADAYVVNVIANAESTVVPYLEKSSVGEDNAADFMRHVNAIKWIIFSDTILLLCPFEDSMHELDLVHRWFVLTLTAQLLSKHMFEEGLPLRGCISYGKYIYKNNCIAGRAILDALEMEKNLELAASVFHPVAYEKMRLVVEPLKHYIFAKIVLKGSLLEYPVPVKGPSVEKLHTLNFPVVLGIGGKSPAWVGSWSAIVKRSFTKHEKLLGEKELMKVHNTARYFSFLSKKFPDTMSMNRGRYVNSRPRKR